SFILDVGRKTFTMDYLKQVVQEMAWYKMNDFHVHLNDNFIFLEKYTNAGLNPLTAYSGFRLESGIKKGGNNGLNKADLTSKDLYYTKDEFRAFIQDSRNYGVNIVPEIDTPAHSLALTKVRPDLRHGTDGRNNDHLNLVGKYEESLSFVQSIFDEYMGAGLADPVFDEDTIVHIGCDEYNAGPRPFRQFSNDMIDYVQGNNRTVRMWGSLTSALEKENGVILPNQLDVKSENVQMNLWNFQYANWDAMYEEGFGLITCNDGGYYIVPNAGYYGDYLDDGTMYNSPINSRSGVTIPAGDDQMLGAGIAVWNDMIDILDNGVSEYDVYDRIKKPFALFGANLWGKDPRAGKALTLDAAKARFEIVGGAPGNDFGYKVEDTNGVISHYPMDNLEAEDLTTAVNSKITTVDGKKALKLNGKESYVKTDLTTVGLNNSLRVKVKRTSASNQEQILFESSYGSIKAVQTGTGRVGFSRENFDYSFNYTLPVDEWVELEFKNQFKTISLYVNGKFVDALGDGEKVANNDGKLMPLLATMMFPVEKIGSATKSFIGYVDDVRLGVNATYNSTMELDYALELVDELSAGTANEAFTALVAEAKTVINTFAPQESVITDLVARITTELDKLETDKADYSKVTIYLNSIPTDLSVFTEESVAVLNQVKESIRMDLPASMQSVVDGYERVLLKALQGLVVLEKPNVNYIPRTAIKKLEASSSSGEGIDRAFDGKNDTIWHSKYTNNRPDPGPPHWIKIQLNDDQVYQISGLVYVPRSGAGNGTFTGYKIQSSANGTTFTDLKSGNWDRNDQAKTVLFDTPITDKYIRLESVTSVGDFGSAAEIKLLVAGVTPDRDGLNELLSKARAIQNSESLPYTTVSWERLQTEITSASNLLNSENPDANDVEIMKGTLAAAMVNLRLTSTPDETPEIAGPFYPVVVMTGDNTAELSFEAATGGENLVYKIVVTKKKNSSTVFETTTAETTVILENISNTEAYIVSVTAKDAEGNEGYPAITQFGAVTSEGGQDTPDGIWVEGVKELFYTGTKQTLKLSVYDGSTRLTEGKDYTISFKNNQNAYVLAEHPETEYAKKAPQAVIKMKGDYKGTKTLYFDINPQSLDHESVTADAVAIKVGAKEPVPVVYWKGTALKVKKDFDVSYNYGEGETAGGKGTVGSYFVKIKGINNFADEIEVPYVVYDEKNTASLSKATVTIDKSLKGKAVAWNKDGAEIPEGKLIVKVNGKELNPETDYEVKYANNKAVGTAYVIVEGNPQAGYSGSKRTSFKVTGTAMNSKDISVSMPAEFPYEGTAIEPMEMDDVKVMSGDKELNAGADFTVTYKNNAKQGKASMILTGNAAAGFTGSKTVTFKITKGKLDAAMLKLVGTTPVTQETEEITVPFTQGGTKPVVKVVADDERELVLGTDYTVSYKNNTKVFGEKNSKLAEIKITGKGNYEGTITRAFKIVPKDAADGELSVVVADKVVNITAKKDGWKSAFKVVDISGKALTANKDYSKNAEYTIVSSDSEAFPAGYPIQPQDSVPVGTKIKVKVTLTGDNFTGTVEGEYTILAKNYDISKATVKIADKDYIGDKVFLTNDDITIKIKNNSATLVKDQDYEIVDYTNNVKKGTAKVTLQGKGVFGGTKTVTFKIVQRDLGLNWKGVVDFLTNLF
ncbi:MAG: family 20 glycosylhydrolase, partial [Lachnospiraceae bacterium]|nr:family 20 glycosylhydrolase [Lachnospiraceae bacterium]